MRVENAQAPAVGGGNDCEISWASVDDGGVGEGGVGEGGDGGEGVAGVGVGLVVGCFGLDLAGVDGAGLGELVFVADVAVGGGRLVVMENKKGKREKKRKVYSLFNTGTDHPDRPLGLIEQSTTCVYSNLRQSGIFNIVICNP